jgi:hypothetical protein
MADGLGVWPQQETSGYKKRDLLIPCNPEGSSMATKVLTTLQDDIDGSAAVETVRFALDGVEWEIDLSERNANRLRNSLRDFIDHARKIGGERQRKAAPSSEIDAKLIRQWAEANGIEINSRGRIPAEIVDRYKSAGN